MATSFDLKTPEGRREYQREWRANHPGAVNDYAKRPQAELKAAPKRKQRRADQRDSNLIRKYGITAAEYDALKADQNGRCAICPETERLVVDHDHDTGRVRGLLCGACNKMLGFARDCPSNLLEGAKYLQKV